MPHLECFRATNQLSTGEKSTLYLRPHVGEDDFVDAAVHEDHWESSVRSSTLTTRGWCCQERLLSPRVLHFTETQLFWECRHCARSEDNLFYSPRPRGIVNVLERSVPDEGSLIVGPLQSYRMLSAAELLDRWYHIVVQFEYSARRLTHPGDKLIALAGLASTFKALLQTRYPAGLWAEDLIAGLCWRRSASGRKAVQYRCPSWSWASQDSAVAYPLSVRKGLKYHARVLDAEVSHRTSNELGAVTGGSLTLCGPTLRGRLGATAPMSSPHNVIDLDDDPVLIKTLELDNGISIEAKLDNDSGEPRPNVIACIFLEDTWAEHGVLFALLLQQTEHGTGNFQRVGLAQKNQQQLSTAQLSALETAPMTTLVVV